MEHNTRDLFGRVRELLLQDWDPIGIQRIPEVQDEYDSYVPGICLLLQRTDSVETVFDRLWQLETEVMGLPGDRERTRRFAEHLVELGH